MNISNVADFITLNAKHSAGHPAIIQSQTAFLGLGKTKEEICSFDELEKKINIFANAFSEEGINAQDRVLVFIPPCIELIATVFALFKIGATPVFIDPGMGIDKLLENIQKTKATALIAISKAILLQKMKGKFFTSIKTIINVDGGLIGKSLKKIVKNKSNMFESYTYSKNDIAAILFTSGATGPSKGVEYSMEMFVEQTKALKELFSLSAEQRDMSGFPLFALYSLSIGLTTYLSESIDARRPAETNGKKLAAELVKHNVSFANGSPSIWISLAKYLKAKKKTIPNLKKLAMFGAPISHELIKDLRDTLPNCTVYTPYGATESLPVSVITDEMILGDTFRDTQSAKGVCVGYLHSSVDLDIRNTNDYSEIGEYKVGEIYINSKMTSKQYFENEDANKKSKLDKSGKLYHFIGDLGYQDRWGRLWYLGRSSHVLKVGSESIYSIEIEGLLNSHPKIEKSALVKVRDEVSVAIIVKEKKTMGDLEKEELFEELRVFGKNYPKVQLIKNFYVVDTFPVDTRHNIKIDRILLGKSLEEK